MELGGRTLEEIFRAVTGVIARAAGKASGPHGPWEEIEIAARDREGLLVDYANELVGRSEVEGRAYDELTDVAIAESPNPALRARIRGRLVTSWRSPLKAATYHGAQVSRDGDRWRASILFDV